ncbi:hypothetical protein W823_09630 [Williamsia sp. D3]|nr:hypothetical protein W823_09630 [Williamsia sp. D3]
MDVAVDRKPSPFVKPVRPRQHLDVIGARIGHCGRLSIASGLPVQSVKFLGRSAVGGKDVAAGDEFVAGCSVRRACWCVLQELVGFVVEPATGCG